MSWWCRGKDAVEDKLTQVRQALDGSAQAFAIRAERIGEAVWRYLLDRPSDLIVISRAVLLGEKGAGLHAASPQSLWAARASVVVPALREVESVLDTVDLTKKLSDKAYDTAIEKYQARLRELEFACFDARMPVIIAYEGWDAAGKGGNIRRVIGPLDPRGYSVIPIAAPKGDDATHHYLWRFWNRIPKAGHLAIFDRTWYGRVLVERVEGFCAEA